MDGFFLSNYEVQNKEGNKVLVMAKGERAYYAVLRRAFPKSRFSRVFDDRFGRYDWGMFIHNLDPAMKTALEELLKLLSAHIYVDDLTLTEIFTLDFHMRPASLSRTPTGQLVYEAKPYSRTATAKNTQKARELAEKFSTFIGKHPTYASADMVVAVPHMPGKAFDLPSELAKSISETLNIKNGSALVQKVRSTKPMKDCRSEEEKTENVRGAFSAQGNGVFEGRQVILVDDIYQSGFTMHEAGAASVLGLAATKTKREA